MLNRVRPALAAAILALGTLAWPGPAGAEVKFPGDAIIAAPGECSGRAVLRAYAPGKLDIAWGDKDGSVRYTQWDAGRAGDAPKVVDGEVVCGLTHHIAGIGRHEDTVRVGVNNSKRLWQWTRGSDGKWACSESGAYAVTYYGPTDGYAVNPKTGLGAFSGLVGVYTPDADKKINPEDPKTLKERQIAYVYEKTPGVWAAEALERNEKETNRAAFCFTAAGEPIAAYQALTNPPAVKAGKASAPGVVDQANDWYPLAVAADPRNARGAGERGARLHLFVSLHSGETNYYASADAGKTWLKKATVLKSGAYGDAAAVALAVAPNGDLAALTPDAAGNLTLATSRDGGVTWALQAIPGGKSAYAGVDFDPAGTLYVAYFSDTDKALHLLSTKPGAAASATRPAK